ncbi:unnamed protein product, partial [Heterosigma akashiwo]
AGGRGGRRRGGGRGGPGRLRAGPAPGRGLRAPGGQDPGHADRGRRRLRPGGQGHRRAARGGLRRGPRAAGAGGGQGRGRRADGGLLREIEVSAAADFGCLLISRSGKGRCLDSANLKFCQRSCCSFHAKAGGSGYI